MRRVYLIDLENVQSAGLDGIDQLTEEDSIFIFYSDKADNLKIDLVRKIQDTPAKVDFIKAYNGTPNALDFQLISYLFFHLEEDAQYWIVSKDTGYDAAIKMSKRMGLSNVRRAPAIKNAVHFGQRAGRISAFRAAMAAEKEMEDAAAETVKTEEQIQSPEPSEMEEKAQGPEDTEIKERVPENAEIKEEPESREANQEESEPEAEKTEMRQEDSSPEVITFFAAGTPYHEEEPKTEQNSAEEEPKSREKQNSAEEEPDSKEKQNLTEAKPETDLTDPLKEEKAEKSLSQEKAEERPAGEKKTGKSGRQKRSRHTNHANHPAKEDRKSSKKTGDNAPETAASSEIKAKEPAEIKETAEIKESAETKENAEKKEPADQKEVRELKDDSSYREELQSILGKECNVATDPETIHMVEDGLRKSANKGQFYQFFRRRMGAARGSEFYKCVRGQFDTLKKLVTE